MRILASGYEALTHGTHGVPRVHVYHFVVTSCDVTAIDIARIKADSAILHEIKPSATVRALRERERKQ